MDRENKEYRIYPLAHFEDRDLSKAIQEAVADKLKHLVRTRLAQECAKLGPEYEQNKPEEGISMEINEESV